EPRREPAHERLELRAQLALLQQPRALVAAQPEVLALPARRAADRIAERRDRTEQRRDRAQLQELRHAAHSATAMIRRASSTDTTQKQTEIAMMVTPVALRVSGSKYPGLSASNANTSTSGNTASTVVCTRPSAVLARSTPASRAISRSELAVFSRI